MTRGSHDTLYLSADFYQLRGGRACACMCVCVSPSLTWAPPGLGFRRCCLGAHLGDRYHARDRTHGGESPGVGTQGQRPAADLGEGI